MFFVCLGFFVPLENFSLIWRRHHCRWRAANFDLCSALMAIEQWGFFSFPHLLWHGAFVHYGHHRGPMTLTPIADRLTVELSYLFVRLRSTPNLPLARRTLQSTALPPRSTWNEVTTIYVDFTTKFKDYTTLYTCNKHLILRQLCFPFILYILKSDLFA